MFKDIESLIAHITTLPKRIRKTVVMSTTPAARKTLGRLKKTEPRVFGELERSWHVNKHKDGTELVNDAPQVAALELGTRPHPVSVEGRERIMEWARVVFSGYPEHRLEAITSAVINRIEEHGSKPTYFVRNTLPAAEQFQGEELSAALEKFAKTDGK